MICHLVGEFVVLMMFGSKTGTSIRCFCSTGNTLIGSLGGNVDGVRCSILNGVGYVAFDGNFGAGCVCSTTNGGLQAARRSIITGAASCVNGFILRSKGLSGCLFSNNCYSFSGDRGPAFRCCRGSRLKDVEVIIGRGNAVRRIGRCCPFNKMCNSLSCGTRVRGDGCVNGRFSRVRNLSLCSRKTEVCSTTGIT